MSMGTSMNLEVSFLSSSSSSSGVITSCFTRAMLAWSVESFISTMSPSRVGTGSNQFPSASQCMSQQCFCISMLKKLHLSHYLHFTHTPGAYIRCAYSTVQVWHTSSHILHAGISRLIGLQILPILK